MEYKINGASVIADIQPVAHVETFAVYRQRPLLNYIFDK